MGVLDFLSPLLTVGTQAYGAQQGAEAQGKQHDIGSALQMLKMKRDQEQASLAAANTRSEMAHRTAEDAGKGVFQGAVRSPGEMASFDADAAKVMDTGLPDAPNAYEDMKASDPERNAPDRYQAISPTQTLDKYQAPEAVQSRKLSAVEELRAKRDAQNQAATQQRQMAHEDRADARQSRSIAALADRMSQKPDPVQIMQGTDKEGQPHFYRVPKVSGDASEVGGLTPGGKSSGGRSTAAITKAIANNQQQLAVIEDALKELEAHPEAVGIVEHGRGLPYIGDQLDQRKDTLGVNARASISNIGSLQIHDRTGAAMTAKEEPRLAPFVPNIRDTPQAIRQKLMKLRQFIGVETDALSHGGTVTARANDGAAQAHLTEGPTREQQLWDAAVAKHGRAKVVAEYGERP